MAGRAELMLLRMALAGARPTVEWADTSWTVSAGHVDGERITTHVPVRDITFGAIAFALDEAVHATYRQIIARPGTSDDGNKR